MVKTVSKVASLAALQS